MGKCIIIAPLYQGEEQAWLTPEAGDLLLCADGGYDAAVRFGLRPDLVIGDFDSMPRDHVEDCPVMQLPVHKDDTDMVVCLKEARKRGYRSFRIAGCLGGRLDHTIANLQTLLFFSQQFSPFPFPSNNSEPKLPYAAKAASFLILIIPPIEKKSRAKRKLFKAV